MPSATGERNDPLDERRPLVKVRDLMTHDVLTLTAETPLKRAAELLARERISGAPVVDDAGQRG